MLLLKGFLIGIAIAAPVGPIGVLCIQRTLKKGRISGFISGLGAATADAFYGFIAAFGVTFVSNFLLSHENVLYVFGGGFLLYLGIKTFLERPVEGVVPAANNLNGGKEWRLTKDYITTLFLTLSNPMTIIAFAAIFAGIGVNTYDDYFAAAIVVIGVFSGSTLWWLILSGIASTFKTRINTVGMGWLNKLSGVIIISFGLAAIVKFYFHYMKSLI
ncbi:MAG: LysE family translocator [Bacillota bacterium]